MIFRSLATVVSVDESRHPVILLDGCGEGGEVTALRASGYNPQAGDRCMVSKVGMRFVAEYAVDGALNAGLSAYEIAVEHGYTGTETEWLASLAGPAGAAGAAGQNGASAYQLAVAGGYVGTEAEWLASLHGADGVGLDVTTSRLLPFVCDFLNPIATGNPPMIGYAVNSGTCAAYTAEPNHPGVVRLVSSSSAYSGYRFTTDPSSLLIAGGEYFEAKFKISNTIQECLHKLGLHDADTYTLGDGGIWIEIFPQTITQAAIRGRTNAGTGLSTTATTINISMLTWYRAVVEVNATATTAFFRLYSEDGTLLWSESLSENLPTAAGQEVGVCVLTTRNSASAYNLLYLDRVAFEIKRDLTR